ncbi:hypothetical protein [Candidatus Nitrotoga sp. BS]|uniref:hypothetical protein n=1 Tax=Candidatus Nitrotoga sp. BS TaxID=2890408 RepID=UPI001EF30AEF|nr:hypothetical protein [Candidatus Nitrotoga sp. BS]
MTHDSLITCEVQKSVKQARKPRKTFTSFSEIDFFLGKAKKQTGATLQGLDVGGVQPPEGIGAESLLAGLRDAILDDDQLLASASGVFDGLLIAFGKGVPTHEPT